MPLMQCWAKFLTFEVVMKKVHLTREQRYTISVMYRQGCTQKMIAEAISKDKSVVSRELKRNANDKGKYFFTCAQQMADMRKERYACPRKFTASMQAFVREKIVSEQWSPKQICGFAGRQGISIVSHERIYRFIREDKLKGGDLWKHTRHRLKHRKRPVGGKQITIKNKVSIEERPAIVDAKTRCGDWEIDTIIGKDGKGAILTITERRTGFLLMEKLPEGKHADALAKAVVRILFAYKRNVHTITSDNGSEFAGHEYIAKMLNADFYFAHPYSSWERGLNEYTNGLIRQYIPKSTDFNLYSNDFIRLVQNKLNTRPREKLNFFTPSKIFYASLYHD
jgi:IS30 family transposase